jgi:hypothetical protein
MRPYYEHGGVTIYHGDCLSDPSVWTVADALVCDPPYGMAYVSGMTAARRPVAGDKSTEARDGVLQAWGTEKPAAVFGTWRVPKPDGVRQTVTWFKASAGPGMGDLSMPWGNATEELYILGQGWHGPRRPNLITTYEVRGNPHGLAAKIGHPTPKPVRLMVEVIRCAPSGVIADPFMGSGTTLVAAKNLGRSAIGIELEERYCEIAARRLSQEVLDLGGAA